MVQLHSFALDTEKIEIGVVLVLRHAEYLSPFEVKYNFPMCLVILQAQKMKGRGVQNSFQVQMSKSGILEQHQGGGQLTFLSVRAWRRPLPIITVRDSRLRLCLGREANCRILPDDSLAR